MEQIQMMFTKSVKFGILGFMLMLAIYFGVVSLISGSNFAFEQFTTFWYFIVALALGFGIQVGLYTYLKNLVGQHGASKKVVAVSGTTSTAGCATTAVSLWPSDGSAEVAGKITRGFIEPHKIEIYLGGKVYRGGYRTEPLSEHSPGGRWPHKRHTGTAHAELTADDGSRLICDWIFHGVPGDGVCKAPGGREYRMTTQSGETR